MLRPTVNGRRNDDRELTARRLKLIQDVLSRAAKPLLVSLGHLPANINMSFAQ